MRSEAIATIIVLGIVLLWIIFGFDSFRDFITPDVAP